MWIDVVSDLKAACRGASGGPPPTAGGMSRCLRRPPTDRRSHTLWLLARFPYSILYRVRADHIRVLAIAHQNRRPFYWRGRR
jgi:hypothetical protein